MSQIFTDDEIIAETPRQKRFLLVLRWIVKIVVTVATSISTVVSMESFC